MKYGSLIFALAALGLSACDSSTPVSEVRSTHAAVGSFKLESERVSPNNREQFMVNISEVMTINGDSVTLRRTCQLRDVEGETVVEATVPAQVNDTHIVLAQPLKKEARLGDFTCAINRKAGVWGYKVQGDFLTLTAADGTVETYGYQVGKRPTLMKHLRDGVQAVGNHLSDALVTQPGNIPEY